MNITQAAQEHVIEAVVIGASAGGVHALLRARSEITCTFDSPASGALRCCESLVWHSHTARFAPSIASRIRRPNAQLISERALSLLSGLPDNFRLPVVAVLHLPNDRDSRLAEIFRQKLSIPVREAADKEKIAPATLYFAGPGYHLSVEMDRSFSLSCEEPVHYARPSIDVLMESAADAYGASLAGILLTGANFDGAAGLARIRQQGGLTVVQDPAEAEVATMPKAAILKLQPSLILTLDGIRSLLLNLDKKFC